MQRADLLMGDNNDSSQKQKNTAAELFKQERPKGFIKKRFLAAIIDFVIVMLICQLAFNVFGAPDWGGYLRMQEAVMGLPAYDPIVLERMKLYQICFILTLSIGAAYEALALTLFGTSAGKFVFGLRVTGHNDGGFFAGKLRLILRSAIKAFSLYLLTALPYVFLCLTALGNPEGRSGFDLFAGTKVIETRSDR